MLSSIDTWRSRINTATVSIWGQTSIWKWCNIFSINEYTRSWQWCLDNAGASDDDALDYGASTGSASNDSTAYKGAFNNVAFNFGAFIYGIFEYSEDNAFDDSTSFEDGV